RQVDVEVRDAGDGDRDDAPASARPVDDVDVAVTFLQRAPLADVAGDRAGRDLVRVRGVVVRLALFVQQARIARGVPRGAPRGAAHEEQRRDERDDAAAAQATLERIDIGAPQAKIR